MGKWMVGIVRCRHETIFLMFVLASALDLKWYRGLINKINPDLIIGCTYKSYPALAYDIIYVRY